MPGSQPIQSLLRGLDILELLVNEPDGLPLRDIAASLHVGSSTAHNLLRTLASRGFVRKADALYRSGPQIERLHRRAESRAYLHACEKTLLELGRRFPDGVFIYAEFRNAGLAIVRRLSSLHPGAVERSAGRSLGPYNSVSGLVFQAFADADSRALLQLEHPFSEEGSRLWKSPEQIETFLDEVRRRGYGLSPFESPAAVLRLAVPVFRSRGGLMGILGASVNGATGDPAALEIHLAEQIKIAAETIGAA